jgi:hypothetical protein
MRRSRKEGGSAWRENRVEGIDRQVYDQTFICWIA